MPPTCEQKTWTSPFLPDAGVHVFPMHSNMPYVCCRTHGAPPPVHIQHVPASYKEFTSWTPCTIHPQRRLKDPPKPSSHPVQLLQVSTFSTGTFTEVCRERKKESRNRRGTSAHSWFCNTWKERKVSYCLCMLMWLNVSLTFLFKMCIFLVLQRFNSSKLFTWAVSGPKMVKLVGSLSVQACTVYGSSCFWNYRI